MAQAIRVAQGPGAQPVRVRPCKSPQGMKVETDVKFMRGEPGFSPLVEVTAAESGHFVKVIDAEGEEEFFVPSGTEATDAQVSSAVSEYLAANPIKVEVADEVAEGDERPVSSAAVYIEVGNIDAILKTI